MTRNSAETAETLIFIGMVIQGISILVLLGFGLFLLAFSFLGGLLLVLAFLALVWLTLIYVFSYARTQSGDYERAALPTLVFAIVSLITGGIINGILYLVAYGKLEDAADEAETQRKALHWRSAPQAYSTLPSAPASSLTPSPPTASVSAPAPSSVSVGSNFCPSCGRPTLPQARFCRNCGTSLL